MRTYQVVRLGEPAEVLTQAEIDPPEPAPGQMVVRVLASALNFPDVLLARGRYQLRPDLPFTPGVEVCGEVVAVGDDVDGCAPGDRVIGSTTLPYGGFAEYALMTAQLSAPAPPEFDNAEASAFWIGYQSGWFGLHRRAQLQPGETLLVHAAAGGVGSAAVQLGKAAGARVIAVVGGPAKAEVARALGADLVVDRHAEDFVEVVKADTGGRGADVIFDPIGGDTYSRSTKCIAFEGRIVVVGFAGGDIQSAPLNHALIKNYSIVGLHWGLYQQRMPGLLAVCHQALTKLVADGALRPLVSERVGWTELPEALQRLAGGLTVGRVVYQA